MSKLMPRAASLLPAALASSTPCADRSTSRQPVNRFLRFHSLWPWRTRTRVPDMLAPVSTGMRWVRSGETEHVAHRIKAGLPAARPKGGLKGAARENRAVLRLVRQGHSLAGAGEDDGMIADNRAAAQGGKADGPSGPRAGRAVAASDDCARPRRCRARRPRPRRAKAPCPTARRPCGGGAFPAPRRRSRPHRAPAPPARRARRAD